MKITRHLFEFCSAATRNQITGDSDSDPVIWIQNWDASDGQTAAWSGPLAFIIRPSIEWENEANSVTILTIFSSFCPVMPNFYHLAKTGQFSPYKNVIPPPNCLKQGNTKVLVHI